MTTAIPEEVLGVMRSEIAFQFDELADWYQAGAADIHADHTYPAQPTAVIPARFVKQTREFYNAVGQQSQVLVQIVYLPYSFADRIKMQDKLVQHGIDATSRWPTIIEISPIPDTAEPVLLRVRQGAA